MLNQPFTVYRTTEAFMRSLNGNTVNLDLHRQRSNSESTESIEAIKTLLSSGLLIPVANVNCSPLNDDLFRLTNSITHFWGDNKEVELLTGSESAFMSSSSVGDIYKDNTGQYYIYCDIGVKPFNI